MYYLLVWDAFQSCETVYKNNGNFASMTIVTRFIYLLLKAPKLSRMQFHFMFQNIVIPINKMNETPHFNYLHFR